MAIKGTGLTLPGLKAEFFQRFNEVSGTTYWNDLCTRIPSTRAKETYVFLGSVPPRREFGTGRLARGMYAESYDIENLEYEITLEVDRDEINDDQTGQIRIRTRELADRAAIHRDSEVARLLVNGHSAGYHSYDGVPFFGSTHESGKSGAQNNTLTITAVNADNATTAEFRSALKSAIATILGLKDDQGEVMSLSAAGLVAVVPPMMYITALEALNSTIVASTTNVLQGAARVIAFPHPTTASVFYLLKTDGTIRPFVFQDRMPIEFTALEQNSDEGFRREKFLYDVRAKYRITYGYWQYALKITFSES